MNSIPLPRRMTKSSTLRPSQSKKLSASTTCNAIQQQPQYRLTADATTTVKKPMRPLTAYHIYFQIEREYIIQTESGPDVSIHENKSYMHDVPLRYRSIKLLPDWYAGPGKKQQKRRHRKSHGKIGFLELSRVISKRWATLDTSDPETKCYVSKIAAQELEEYKLEMKQYKELLTSKNDSMSVSNDASVSIDASFTPVKHVVDFAPSASMISPTIQPCQPLQRTSSLISLDEDFIAALDSCEQDDEIDYTICDINNCGHYVPSPGSDLAFPDELLCDPLYELEDECNDFQHLVVARCVSPLSLDLDVGLISVDHFI